jgi:hypothetical protein
MFRRSWIVVLSLGLLTGCGMQMRKIQREEMVALESVNRIYPQPSHRVALAAFEAMRSELTIAEFSKDSEFRPGPKPKNPKAPLFKDGQPLPPNFPAFWVEFQSSGQKVSRLLTLDACHFVGRTKQGQPVTVEVKFQPPDGTLVTVHIDQDDKSASKALLQQLEERLAHPANPPGSLEEVATFKAFFGGVESREALPSLRTPTSEQPPLSALKP